MGRRRVKQLLSPPQDKGNDGVKELDSLKSDRLRTIQLNVCSSEEVEKAVEIIRSSLEDPEKGREHLRQPGGPWALPKVPFLNATLYCCSSSSSSTVGGHGLNETHLCNSAMEIKPEVISESTG